MTDVRPPVSLGEFFAAFSGLPSLASCTLGFSGPVVAPLGFPMELLRCTRLSALRLLARNSQTLLDFSGLPAGISALGSLRHLSIVNCTSQQLILALSSLTALTELNGLCSDHFTLSKIRCRQRCRR